MNNSFNIFKRSLLNCGKSPMAGAYSDGCCNTGRYDSDTYTVYAVVLNEFYGIQKVGVTT